MTIIVLLNVSSLIYLIYSLTEVATLSDLDFIDTDSVTIILAIGIPLAIISSVTVILQVMCYQLPHP
jgi:hypothetical protein